jgi:hypothetical protein
MPLQDPALGIGYDGREPGGRNRFGVFAAAWPAGSEGDLSWPDADVQIDRILVTRYEPMVIETVLDQRFTNGTLDRSVWVTAVPEHGSGSVEVRRERGLCITNSGGGPMWKHAAGIWTRPDRFPLFRRPVKPGRRVYVDFLGVALPPKSQRCAMGLSSVDPATRGRPKLPDDFGPGGGLAYFFWVLPDNDRLIQNSNQLRAAVIGEKYAATDNYHHAWIWPYTETRDLRLEVTAEDVRWYLRKDAKTAWRVLRDSEEFFYRRPAAPADRNTGYWRPLYDPAVRTGRPYDGTEPNGRSEFGVFLHVSAAGRDGIIAWEDGSLSIESVKVTVVDHGNQALGVGRRER